MLTIIIGGAGSGKSAFAEAHVCKLPGRKIYLAAMLARDGESLARIERHRARRAHLGFETLEPFAEYCAQKGKGFFVLLRTSNTGAADIEQQELKQGGLVLDCVGKELNRIKDKMAAAFPGQTCSPVGAVVGCTHQEDAAQIRAAYPEIFFLIPGYGAQGGAADICGTLLQKAGGAVNSSRGILCAYKKDASLQEKLASKTLTLDDIADSALRACLAAKIELTNFQQNAGGQR